ncbi:MAG: peptidase S10 [Candidatus Glassbacteria bacterium]
MISAIGRTLLAALLAAGTAPGGLSAAADSTSQAAAPAAKEPPAELTREVSSVTRHSVTISGKKIDYSATAGTIMLREEDGTPKASVFYIAYTRDGVTDLSKRPLSFSFNGGPGSSSVWLHLGLLGPRRVQLEEDGSAPPPPYHLVDNSFSLLDATDLVFIDPVSTGFSRAVSEEDPGQFHGVEEDIESVGKFIRLYTTRNKRWVSPKFLIGESYGTTRAAGLSGHLQEELGLYLNGIILVSAVLDFQTIRFNTGNDLPYVLFLPSYTATAWYHRRLPAELQEGGLAAALEEAERFAGGDYRRVLFEGSALSAEEKARVADNLARLTGLGRDYVKRADLRISMPRFGKELLRDRDRTMGRYDSRFTGIDRDGAGETPDYDPSYASVHGAFTAAFNQYVRAELAFESDLPYEILTGRVHPWNFGNWENRYVNVAETLRSAMTQNPHLKVFVANGYYDLATPFFATQYTFDHLGLDRSLRGNVSLGYYEAGHMMYIESKSLAKLKLDLAAFISGAAPE